MNAQELEKRFEKQSVSTVQFTPETLKKVFDNQINLSYLRTKLCSDEIPQTARVIKAETFIKQDLSSSLNIKINRYCLSETQVAVLIVLFGSDAVQNLFDRNKFMFKSTTK